MLAARLGNRAGRRWPLVIEVAEVGFWVRFLRRYRVVTGKEALVGATAEVIEACDPRGRVRFRGEIWRAECDSRAEVGDRVVGMSMG